MEETRQRLLQIWSFLSDEILDALKYPAEELEWIEDSGDVD